MKTRTIILLFSIIMTFCSFMPDIIDGIAAAIRSGNSGNISKYFIENIDLKVIYHEDVYNKWQAEMILKDFFAKHPVKSYNVVHKSEPKNGLQYVIGNLETSSRRYRIYFLIKATASETLIHQFRIETENE